MPYIIDREQDGRLLYYVVEDVPDGPDGEVRQQVLECIGDERDLMRLAMQGVQISARGLFDSDLEDDEAFKAFEQIDIVEDPGELMDFEGFDDLEEDE